MRDAVTQIEHALDPDTGYVNGCPWDFGILGRDGTSSPLSPPREEDAIYPGFRMLNVWAPDHGRDKGDRWISQQMILHTIADRKPGVDDLAQTLASLMFNPYDSEETRICSSKADSNPEQYRVEAQRLVGLYDFHTRTGNGTQEHYSDQTCGSCGQERGPSKCSRCQEVNYCNRRCQRADFAKHKVICPMLVRLKEVRDSAEEMATFAEEVRRLGG